MDTIIYLTLERKENAGETKDAPPVFSIKERPGSAEDSSEYRLLYVDVPRAMLKNPQEKKPAQNHEGRGGENRGGCREMDWPDKETDMACAGEADGRTGSFAGGRKLLNLKKGQQGKRSILEWMGSLFRRAPGILGGECQTERQHCCEPVCPDTEGSRTDKERPESPNAYVPAPKSPGHDVQKSEVISAHEKKMKEIIAQERKKAFRREALQLNLPWIRELSEYLVPYRLQSDACSMVYDDSVDKWLKKYDLCGWWEENWPIPLFEGYHAPVLVRKLMEHVHLSHFLVLGYASCVPGLLVSHARRMKSLRFLLREMPEELDIFLEDFYEEYGLAAACRVTDGESFKGERIQCVVPTAILDFSGESHLLTADVVKGSMWLDMDSMEEKRRRIEDRNTGIFYFSMKKEWKRTIRL